jgi:hypothetical protein
MSSRLTRSQVLPGQFPDTFHARGCWVDRWSDVAGSGWDVAFGHPSDELLFPGESRVAGTYRQSANERTITVRVDCANAQPVEVARTVTLQVGMIEWFDAPTCAKVQTDTRSWSCWHAPFNDRADSPERG